MAGFSVSLSHLLSRPEANFATTVRRGYQESEFLAKLVKLEELQTDVSRDRVLVWHTRTERPDLNMEEKYLKYNGVASDQGIEV